MAQIGREILQFLRVNPVPAREHVVTEGSLSRDTRTTTFLREFTQKALNWRTLAKSQITEQKVHLLDTKQWSVTPWEIDEKFPDLFVEEQVMFIDADTHQEILPCREALSGSELSAQKSGKFTDF